MQIGGGEFQKTLPPGTKVLVMPQFSGVLILTRKSLNSKFSASYIQMTMTFDPLEGFENNNV